MEVHMSLNTYNAQLVCQVWKYICLQIQATVRWSAKYDHKHKHWQTYLAITNVHLTTCANNGRLIWQLK